MKLDFETYSTRNEFSANTKKYFVESIHLKHDYYSFEFGINITKNGKPDAEIRGYAFDEDANEDNNFGIEIIADNLACDAGNAIRTMIRSDFYGDILAGTLLADVFSCYISKVYVWPEYRVRGIGKFMLANLKDILQYAFNINTRCITIVPKPQRPGTDAWENDPDPDGEKLKLMIAILEKVGYRQIDKTGVWACKELGGLKGVW